MPRTVTPALAALGLALALTVPNTAARADDYVGVARISVLNGTVTVKHGDNGDTVAAAINAPVMVGDYITTSNGSRAEIQIDDANFVRAGTDAQLRFTRMDPTDHIVQLAAGTVVLSLLRLTDGRPQIETPSIGIRPDAAGQYRVTVTSDGDTLLTVRSGQAELLAPQGAQTISTGTSVLIRGSSSNPSYHMVQGIAYDDFDAWNADRDRFAQRAYAATSYASSDIVGLADLSSYGRWISAPGYGNVWSPYNQFNWAPYQYGRWAWAQQCGWTWVGFEPWGWAPYHYGRWFYAPAFGWAWYPGPIYGRYYWAPALVAFFNFGGGGFGFSIGNIGWVPLAPFEPYYPYYPYRGSARVTTVLPWPDIRRRFANVNSPGGVNAIHAGNLNNGQKYQYIPIHNNDLRGVTLSNGNLPVEPTRAGLSLTNGPGSVAKVTPVSPRFMTMPSPKLEQTLVQRGGASTPTTRLNGSSAVRTVEAVNPWSKFGSTNVQTQNPTHGVTQNATHSVTSTQPLNTVHSMNNASSGPTVSANVPTNVWSRFTSSGSSSLTTVHSPSLNAVHSPRYNVYGYPQAAPVMPYRSFQPTYSGPSYYQPQPQVQPQPVVHQHTENPHPANGNGKGPNNK